MRENRFQITKVAVGLAFMLCLTGCGKTAETEVLGNQINPSDVVANTRQSLAEGDSVETKVAEEFAGESGELKYVMIYNPAIYKEYSEGNTKLSTGDFGNQVDLTMARADGIEMPTEFPFTPWSQSDIDSQIPVEELQLDGNRANTMISPYYVGESREFYCFDNSMNRTVEQFECLYAGSYCNVWSYDAEFNSYAAEIYGNAFDEEIYSYMLEAFGTARFADNGGKVNLLFYPMADGLAGCFTPADLFSQSEVNNKMVVQYGMNTDHAILNINSSYAIYEDLIEYMCGTMAHEFQHLICATDSLYALNGESCSTWFNEAMSGYVEEVLYPGSKDISGHYEAFALSDRIRYGQSLYNFEIDDEDIGVYGSVYLFSEYIADLTGKDNVYRDFHDDWRESYSMTICDAEGLYGIIPTEKIEEIANIIDYGEIIEFEDEQEEWMSKLTLAFYLSLLSQEETSISAYDKVDPLTLLYDEVEPANIKGGGRVIVAVKDNKFDIPENADSGLVYIGLDGNFQPISQFVIK